VLTVGAMLRTEVAEVVAHARRGVRVVLALAWVLLASPVLMALLAASLPLPRLLVETLVLWAATASMTSAPALAFVIGLDASLTLLVMVLSTLAMPLVLPPVAVGLIGIDIEIGVVALMLRLAGFIGGAALVAAALRRTLGARLARHPLEINGANVIALVVFATAVMDGVQETLLRRPSEALLYLALAYGAAVAFQIAGTLIFLGWGRRAALTMGVLGANRNFGIVGASLGAAAPAEMTLFLAATQVPVYTFPALLRPICAALTSRKAGP
jgi:bile acid:Na+ symporter, BASS family